MNESRETGIDPKLAEWLAALIDESITDEQFAALDRRLKEDHHARRLYFDYLQIHDDLYGLAVRMIVEDGWAEPLPIETRNRSNEHEGAGALSKAPPVAGRRKTYISSRKMLVAGAAVLTLVVVSVVWRYHASPQPKRQEPLATLTLTANCVWEEPMHPQLGDSLAASPLKLREGAAEITLDSGVRLLVEAPAHFELVDTDNSLLHAGRIVTRVPPTAVGFAIETPHGKFVDLGTEFGVSVEPGPETIVQVFDGAVAAELRYPDAAGERRRRLVAGEAVRIDGSDKGEMQKAVFSHERFLRTFYAPNIHEGDELIPFKPSQISSLDVLPVAAGQASSLPPGDGPQPGSLRHGEMIIDGDLPEWDLSGMFEARCAEPFAESHYVFGSLMYDEQNLYVAARVGDPMPLRSVMDPETAGEFAWVGGSLELRLSTDRTLGWPVKAVKPSRRKEAPFPRDTSERLAHLTLWYFEPREQPCLQIQYGMDLDRKVINPPGWTGVFRKAADGKSYTLECAIPWSLLGAGDDPPRAGDELGLCWIVNWSDASGRRWRGQLIENKNPAYAGRGEKFLTFMFAETWGKAIYK